METPGADHDRAHPHPSRELAESPEASLGQGEAAGSLVGRLGPAAAEIGPVVGRFTEIQAACACASGCPACLGLTVGSLALPFIIRGRGSQEETE